MSFGKITLGFFTLVVLILILDLALVYIADWRQRVQRERAARKYGMSPGAFKPVSKHWWAQ